MLCVLPASVRPQVAELVLYLASEKAAAVTGSIYNIDGGFAVKA